MNPYRESREEIGSAQESQDRDDELVLIGVWFFLGCVLVISDVLASESLGVAFSLGMLVLVGAIAALVRYRMGCNGRSTSHSSFSSSSGKRG